MVRVSRYPEAVAAILAALRAAGVRVVDGPVVSGDYRDAVYVGYDGDPDGDYRSADLAQEWIGLGAKSRTEQLDIAGAAVVTVGQMDVAAARSAAFVLLGAVELALRADPSLGQAPPFVAEVVPQSVFTEPGEGGLQVRVTTVFRVKTRV